MPSPRSVNAAPDSAAAGWQNVVSTSAAVVTRTCRRTITYNDPRTAPQPDGNRVMKPGSKHAAGWRRVTDHSTESRCRTAARSATRTRRWALAAIAGPFDEGDLAPICDHLTVAGAAEAVVVADETHSAQPGTSSWRRFGPMTTTGTGMCYWTSMKTTSWRSYSPNSRTGYATPATRPAPTLPPSSAGPATAYWPGRAGRPARRPHRDAAPAHRGRPLMTTPQATDPRRARRSAAPHGPAATPKRPPRRRPAAAQVADRWHLLALA